MMPGWQAKDERIRIQAVIYGKEFVQKRKIDGI